MSLTCCCRTGYVPMTSPRKKVMHDNGKQFVSKSFRQYLKENDIKDKPIPAAYPQLQGKVEAYNKIVKKTSSWQSKTSPTWKTERQGTRHVCRCVQPTWTGSMAVYMV